MSDKAPLEARIAELEDEIAKSYSDEALAQQVIERDGRIAELEAALQQDRYLRRIAELEAALRAMVDHDYCLYKKGILHMFVELERAQIVLRAKGGE